MSCVLPSGIMLLGLLSWDGTSVMQFLRRFP
jgi:hypothetical protein